MDQRQGLFRKEALRHVASPDDLDQVIAITNPVGWAVLAGFGLIVAAIVAYAFIGRIPVTVVGQGAILPTEGIADVVSLHAGQVTAQNFKMADMVAAGQALGTVQTTQGPVTLTAPVAGQIVEVVAPVFSAVAPNAVIARIVPSGEPLRGVLYVPIDTGSSVRVGQRVQVTPASQTSEASGFIRGTVSFVGQVPVSNQQLTTVLGPSNARLVQGLAAEPLRVDVDFDRNPDGSLVWSSGQGRDALVRAGVAISGTIELSVVAPIEVVMPGLVSRP